MTAMETLVVISTDPRSSNLGHLRAGVFQAIVEKPGMGPES
jgi:hypothetical protein